MIVFLLAALIFAAFCVFMLYITRTSFFNLLRLRREGIDLTAVVTGYEEGPYVPEQWRGHQTPLVRYSYEYEGKSYQGAQSVTKKQLEQLSWGTSVAVRIVASVPSSSLLLLNNPMRTMIVGVITAACLTLTTFGLALSMVTMAALQP